LSTTTIVLIAVAVLAAVAAIIFYSQLSKVKSGAGTGSVTADVEGLLHDITGGLL
jgi:hypothetical protein